MGDRKCWVCLEADGGAERPLERGCACRGGAGFVHVDCLASAASASPKLWSRCPVCEQRWTGRLQLGIARAHVAALEQLPAEHHDRLFAATTLADALGDAGRLEEAIAIALDALQKRRAHFGADDESTLTSLSRLGTLYIRAGQHPEALQALSEALAGLRATRAHSAECLSCMNNLAALHSRMTNDAAAAFLIEEALAIKRAQLGDRHPDTLFTQGNLGALLERMGQHDRALALLQATLEAQRQLLGSAHPSTIGSIGNLASTHWRMRRLDLALPLMQEAAQASAQVLGEAHPDAVEHQRNLASLQAQQEAAVQAQPALTGETVGGADEMD